MATMPSPSRLEGVYSEPSTSTLIEVPCGSPIHTMSVLRKYTLLSCFCLAQYLDAFNVSSMFSAMPTLEPHFRITANESPWLICAFQVTFASFLLVSGKISDVFNPKYVFICGIAGLGSLSLGSGFANTKVVLLLLRSIAGIFGSLTVPAAVRLIIQSFPCPQEQGFAIGLFGGFAAFGNVSGLVLSAVFVQYASWRWIFWFMALVCCAIAAISICLAPSQTRERKQETVMNKIAKLDLPGVSTLTAAFLLLICSLTFAPAKGWWSPLVLSPLVVSIFLIIAFFVWEARLPDDCAAIPPRMWFYQNFSVLLGVALLPFFWWTNIFTIFTTLWQDVYHWSVILTAVHMLPIGIAAFVLSFTGSLSQIIHAKYLILSGLVLMATCTTMLPFADSESRYWSIVFPAFLIGSSGAQLTFTHTNVAIFRSVPPSMSGTVAAMFNGALQLGSAVGIAISGTIQNGVNHSVTPSQSTGFAGQGAALWLALAVVLLEMVCVLVFFTTDTTVLEDKRTMSAC